jgi:uncharacterized membrane protein YcaP (DUF421 family)
VLPSTEKASCSAGITSTKILEGEPRLLVKDGSPRHDELHACHISMDELLARAREAGLADLARVDRAHLETSGKISFVVTPGERR